MSSRIVNVISASENDQANHANHGKRNCKRAQYLLKPGSVSSDCPPVSEPALSSEDSCETDHGSGSHGNEERLELMSSNVRNIPVFYVSYSEQKDKRLPRTRCVDWRPSAPGALRSFSHSTIITSQEAFQAIQIH